MPRTYEPIASQTTSGTSTSSVTFSSIPGTYTDLVLVAFGTTTGSDGDTYWSIQYNSDTGTNYSTTILTGNGSTASSLRFSNRSNFNFDYRAFPSDTEVSGRIVQIFSYANTNVHKTALGSAFRAGSGVDRIVGLWRSTSAITSITVTSNKFNFASGCTLNLYGVKAA